MRERKEDVPLLVNYFVDRYAKRAGKKIKHIQRKTLEALEEYPWPGNVRELQNVIERSLIIGETNEFSIDKSWVANEPQQLDSASSVRKVNERHRRKVTERSLGERRRGQAWHSTFNSRVQNSLSENQQIPVQGSLARNSRA